MDGVVDEFGSMKANAWALEGLGVLVLVVCGWIWVSWICAYPRAQALHLAPAWDAQADCAVMSVIPWHRGERYARCWPLGLPSQRPIAFVGLHLVMAGAVMAVVVGGRRRRARKAL